MAHVDIEENFTPEGIAKIEEIVRAAFNANGSEVKFRAILVDDDNGNRKIITATSEEIAPSP